MVLVAIGRSFSLYSVGQAASPPEVCRFCSATAESTPTRLQVVLQRLRQGDRLAVDRHQGGRAFQHRLELGTLRFVGGDLQQPVLGNVKAHPARAERPAHRLHVGDLQAAIVGDGDGRAGTQELNELGDRLAFCIGRHVGLCSPPLEIRGPRARFSDTRTVQRMFVPRRAPADRPELARASPGHIAVFGVFG